MSTIPMLPLVVLATSAVFTRVIRGSWLAPSAFTGALWFCYSAVPLVVTPYPVRAASLWVLVSLVLATQLGALIHEDGAGHACGSPDLPASATAVLRRWCLACTLVSGCGALFFVATNLLRFGLPVSLEGFLSLGNLLYPLTQAGEEAGWGIRLARMWMFAGTTLAGMTLARSTGLADRLLAFGSFVPPVIFGASVAARFGILMATCCFLGGFMSLWMYDTRGRALISPRLILMMSLSAAVATGMYVRLDLIRGVERYSESEYRERLGVNFFGYLAAFDHWAVDVRRPGAAPSLGWGTYTFAGVAEALGIQDRQLGLYQDSVPLERHSDTNIYTAFRGWIEDFSFAGGLMVGFLFGASAGMAYAAATLGRSHGLPVLGAYYAFVLWSPIVSIFNYNGVILAWLVLVPVLALCRRKTPAFPVDGT